MSGEVSSSVDGPSVGAGDSDGDLAAAFACDDPDGDQGV